MSDKPIPMPSVALVQASEVPALLTRIRPAWQAKNLIARVRNLVQIDPSSACQRLFNAAIHDLREKVVVAGIDIARDAAKQYKLPPVERAEDIENYSTDKLIDLTYRIGLLTRPEWRRLARCYEIRRDLEHEDDEYEAGVEDCVYIFKTCIEVVLSRDPVQLLRVQDIKDVIEQPVPSLPAQTFLEDYKQAPNPRQEEILKFLISTTLNASQSEIVQQNAYNAMVRFEPLTQNAVKLSLAANFQERVGRSALTRRMARVAFAAGVLPYLKKANLIDCFEEVHAQMEKVGTDWRGHNEHGELLRSFRDLGGLGSCPLEARGKILKWLVLTYLGKPGGRTMYGNIRHVFYSDTAAPLIAAMIKESAQYIKEDFDNLRKDRAVVAYSANQYIARRLEQLADIIEAEAD